MSPVGLQVRVLARRALLELWREPVVLALVVGLPVFFFLLVAVGYSHEPRPRTWTLAVEAGAVEPGLVEALGAARHADGRTAFRLVEPGSEPAPDLTVGAADGGLAYRGDALSVDHVMATNRFEQEVAAWRSAELQLVQAAPPFRGPPSDFDAYAPGMLVFAVLLLVPQTAFLVGRDVRRGTMDRLRLTGMSPWGYLGGVTLAQGIIAVLMGLLLLGLCLAWGYRFGGDRLVAGALTLAVLVVVGLSAVAVGLAVGPFVKSDSSALNLGSGLTMIQVFLSGAFFPMPSPTLVELGQVGTPGSFVIGAYDVFPATHGMRALLSAMAGEPRHAVAPLAVAAVLSAVWFIVAAVFFRRRVLG